MEQNQNRPEIITPAWANELDERLNDPELLERAGGDQEKFRLLSDVVVADIRAKANPEDEECQAFLNYKQNIVTAYEHYKKRANQVYSRGS